MNDKLFKLIWTVVIVGMLFTPGCKKIDNSLNSEICHKWEWTLTTGGYAGVMQTPGSEGYTQAIKFEENGVYRKYKNNVVIENGYYSITRAVSWLDDKTYDMVVFDGGSISQAIIMATGNTLILRDEVIDGFTQTYRR